MLQPVTRRLLTLPPALVAGSTLLAAVAAHGLGSWFIVPFHGEPLYVMWPGVGVGLAVLWIFGQRYWPWFFAGSLLAQWLSTGTLGFYTWLFPVVDTAEALVAVTLLRRSGADVGFGRVSDVGRYVVWAAGVPTAIGAACGLSAAGLLFGDPYYHDPITWMHWWLADVQGMLHTAPVLLTWAYRPAPGAQRWPSWLWWPLVAMVVAACASVGRTPVTAPFAPALYLLPVTIILGAAVTFGARGAITTSLLTTVTLVLSLPYQTLDESMAVNLYAGIEIASLGLLLVALTVAALMTEVTASAQAREALAAQLSETARLDGLGRIAAGVAHDFNNLLTAILGNTALVRQRTADPRARQLLHEVEETSQRAADLCRQMLTVGGLGRRTPQPVGLGELVEDMGPVLRSATRRDIDLRFDLDPRLPAIDADPTQAGQVLMNLVANAAEACPEDGSPRVTVGVRRLTLSADGLRRLPTTPTLAPGHYVELSVQDTGEGMPEETVGRIFDPFFTTRFTGRGLGLAVVHGIVRAHRGGILVRSAPGRGTTVSVYWPAAAGRADEHALAVTPTDGPLAGHHVLVVMPDAESDAATARLVEGLGGHVESARSLAQAVHLGVDARRLRGIDLLLVDADSLRSPTDLGMLLSGIGPRRCIVAARDVTRFEALAPGNRGDVLLLDKPFGPKALTAMAAPVAVEASA